MTSDNTANTSTERPVLHAPLEEEAARNSWYLQNRDLFIADVIKGLVAKSTPETKPLPILDAGCGVGGLTKLLRKMNLDVSSIDLDEPSVQWGIQQGRLDPEKTRICSLTEIPFEDAQFDITVSSEVLEHIEDHVAALKELLRVTKGPVVITVPAHPVLWTDSDTVLLHQRRYTRKMMEELAEQAGGKWTKLHQTAFIPGFAVILFKLLKKLMPKREKPEGEKTTPLALRFQLPKWMNNVIGAVFRVDLKLGQLGLIPWGHAWWGIVERNDSERA